MTVSVLAAMQVSSWRSTSLTWSEWYLRALPPVTVRHRPRTAQARAIVVMRHIERPEAALSAWMQSSMHSERAGIRCARTDVVLPNGSPAKGLEVLKAHGQLAWRDVFQLCSLRMASCGVTGVCGDGACLVPY